MPLDISTNAIAEMNKMNTDSRWILLLTFIYSNETPVRVCLDNTEITWGGNVYSPASFELSGLTETKDSETPGVPLTVHDVNRAIIPVLQEYDGAIGSTVVLSIINSTQISSSTPELQETMEILECSFDEDGVITFKLGAEDLSSRACPPSRYLKNHCRFKFKGTDGRCGYTGSETKCNRTLARCRALNNQSRFGGFVGLGTSGVQV
ncbi:MAG: hypothetical protein GY799_21445 [Desulfobulbaceae bacterium]|nr:hypothetical protein [Desulfobulbaceae bacterium]